MDAVCKGCFTSMNRTKRGPPRKEAYRVIPSQSLFSIQAHEGDSNSLSTSGAAMISSAMLIGLLAIACSLRASIISKLPMLWARM
jgi:hypothetical protein